jgi:hypothetical protein
MTRMSANQHIRHAQKCAGQGCPAPVGRLTAVWHPIDHECLLITNPATLNPNAARRDAGRRYEITFAEASSLKHKKATFMPSVSHRRASLFISGLLTMAEPLEPSAVWRPGRYGRACRWCPKSLCRRCPHRATINPSPPKLKPNWRVASCMTRMFANQHIRHAQKCAGQGCPAPVWRLTDAWL